MSNIEHSEQALLHSFRDILGVEPSIDEMYRMVWQVIKFVSEIETEQLTVKELSDGKRN